MKTISSPALALLASFVAALPFAHAGSGTDSPLLIVSAGTPTLALKNVRIDPRDGKIRGTARTVFGYAAPASAHVHAYAYDGRGRLLAEICDNLSGSLLRPNPRLSRRGADAFSLIIPAPVSTVREVRLEPHTGRCEA
jgi:hypothetical protein